MTSSQSKKSGFGLPCTAFDLEKLKTMASEKVEKKKSEDSLLERHLSLKGNELDSQEIFANGREIIVRHGAEKYRLRLTAQNKLILTK